MSAKVAFKIVLYESIVEGLESALGRSSANAIILQFKPSEIEKPAELHVKLLEIFGDGAFVLEKMIMTKLYDRLGQSLRLTEDFDFEEKVYEASEFVATTSMILRPYKRTTRSSSPEK